jgi:REP element-mobilizing transposase RayT
LSGYHHAVRLRGRHHPAAWRSPLQQRQQQLFIHLVWSTWDRAPVLTDAVRAWLWPAMATQARELGCVWAVVGGVEDHVHVLCALPAAVAVADLVRRLKGWTARAANAQHPDSLRWQGG